MLFEISLERAEKDCKTNEPYFFATRNMQGTFGCLKEHKSSVYMLNTNII